MNLEELVETLPPGHDYILVGRFIVVDAETGEIVAEVDTDKGIVIINETMDDLPW